MKLRNFDEEYKRKGAYQLQFRNYRLWWRNLNWRKLAGLVEEGDIVLDLGSGPGMLGDYILARGGQPFGIDNSPEAVKLSRALKEPVQLGEMTDIPFGDGYFDVVLCSLSLHYLSQSELYRCLDEIRRVLKKWGWFAVAYPNTKVKRWADDAIVLDWPVLEQMLEQSRFAIAGRTGITPYFPRWLIAIAESRLFPFVKLYLDRKAEHIIDKPDLAYHYIIWSYRG